MSRADRLCEFLRYVRAVFSDPETPEYAIWAREQHHRLQDGGHT